MKQEEAVRKQRMSHFFSTKFVANLPGPLFPSSWQDLIEIERAQGPGKAPVPPQHATLHKHSDSKGQTHMFDHFLKSATPEFDRSTEDGIIFRVYRVGNLEVRTTREPNADEIVGEVFSTRAAKQASMQGNHNRKIEDHEELA